MLVKIIIKEKKTAFVDVSLPLKSGHLHCGKDNMEKVGPTKAKEPPPCTIGSLKDKRNRKYLLITWSEKRNWKKDNPVGIADYATVGSYRFEPFALTKG